MNNGRETMVTVGAKVPIVLRDALDSIWKVRGMSCRSDLLKEVLCAAVRSNHNGPRRAVNEATTSDRDDSRPRFSERTRNGIDAEGQGLTKVIRGDSSYRTPSILFFSQLCNAGTGSNESVAAASGIGLLS